MFSEEGFRGRFSSYEAGIKYQLSDTPVSIPNRVFKRYNQWKGNQRCATSWRVFFNYLILLTNRIMPMPVTVGDMPKPHAGVEHDTVWIETLEESGKNPLTQRFRGRMWFTDDDCYKFVTDAEQLEQGEQRIIYSFDTDVVGDTVVHIHDTIELGDSVP